MSSTFDVARICWEMIHDSKLVSRKRNYINHWNRLRNTNWNNIVNDKGEIANKYGLIQSPAKIYPIETENFPTLAKRPMYSILDCSKTNKIIGIERKHWRYELKVIDTNIFYNQ